MSDSATGVMDLAAQQAMSGQLGSGERLLWAGSPTPGIRLRVTDAVLIPFSLAWGGFAFFWEYQVIKSGAPFVMRLFGLPFVLIGLHFIVGRYFVDAWQRSRTVYGLTNQRALIVMGRQVRSLNLQTLGDVTLSERPDGTGTILFVPSGMPEAWTRATALFGAGRKGLPGFEMVPNARLVCDRIRAAQRDASPGAAL